MPVDEKQIRHYAANPCVDPAIWHVWDIYSGLPAIPVFFGSMEDAGLVADALNNREVATHRDPDRGLQVPI